MVNLEALFGCNGGNPGSCHGVQNAFGRASARAGPVGLAQLKKLKDRQGPQGCMQTADKKCRGKRKASKYLTGCHKQAKLSSGISALHGLVGGAEETEEAHRARHQHFTGACPRCSYIAHRKQWLSKGGSFAQIGRDPRSNDHKKQKKTRSANRQVFWLQERPSKWGGPWGLGCFVCHRAAEASKGAKLKSRFNTRWARYEVKAMSSMQLCAIRAHAQSDSHKAALRYWNAPDTPLHTLIYDREDNELLKGNVPQPPDWMRIWRACRSPTSFRALSQSSSTEEYVLGGRHRMERRMVANMTAILALAVRRQKQKILRESPAISLSVDDRGPYRVIRYQCCLKSDHMDPEELHFWHSGVLGVLRNGGSCRGCRASMQTQTIQDSHLRKTNEAMQLLKRKNVFYG